MSYTKLQLLKEYVRVLMASPDAVDSITAFILKTPAQQKADIQAYITQTKASYQANLNSIDAQTAAAKTEIQQNISDLSSVSTML